MPRSPRPAVLRRTAVSLGLAGVVVVGLTSSTAATVGNVLRSDRSDPRACTARVLPPGTPGADRREFTSTVDGLVQARLRPVGGAEGDWDLAVFDRDTGAIVAGSAAPRSRELAEGFVRRTQRLVVQGCRYAGPARAVTLGVDFLALRADGSPSAGAAPATPQRAELVRVATPSRQDKDRLLALGLDVTERADATTVDVILANDDDRRTLAGSGLRYRVLEADLSARSRANVEADRRYAAGRARSQLPSGRTGYRHLYDYDHELKELARRNPSLVRVFTLPLPSHEGRDVTGVEIATDVGNVDDGKPVNLTLGVHHAREWPAGEHAVEWAHELVDGHRGSDRQIRDLVGRTRNIVVPIVNVDGFSISRQAEPNGAFTRFDYEMKRKNCQVADSPPEFATGVCPANPAGRVRGADPNRNYAGFWGGPGASPTWSSDTYRGAAPFSEPETRNVRHLVSTRQVTNLLTLHTYSNLVLRVPGTEDRPRPVDEEAYRALGDRMASRNGYASKAAWQLYDTSGTLEDWSYWATGGWAFTIEIGASEFHPPYATGVVAEYAGLPPAPGAGKGGNRRAFLEMLANAADPAAHATLVGSAPRGYRLHLRKTFQTPTSPVIGPDRSVGQPIMVTDTLTSDLTAPGGRFTWAVNPSTRPSVEGPREAYTLTCANPRGQLVGTTDVVVDRGQTVDVGEVCTGSARAAKPQR